MPRHNGPASEAETDETTRPDGAASSTGSSAASTDFIADAGPEHDPDGAPPPEEPPSADILDGLAWDSEVVRNLLTAQGQALHTFAGKAQADWIYTRDELRAIAPPLTRILNRYDATRAAAATGDELALVIGLTGYVGRSIEERRRALRAQAAAEDEELGIPVAASNEPPADFTDDELPETPPTPRRSR